MENEKMSTADVPSMQVRVGNTTYLVRVHFSETAKETLEDKIKRMLKNEVEQMF